MGCKPPRLPRSRLASAPFPFGRRGVPGTFPGFDALCVQIRSCFVVSEPSNLRVDELSAQFPFLTFRSCFGGVSRAGSSLVRVIRTSL